MSIFNFKVKKLAKIRNYDGMLINDETPFAVKEAFKTLRTNLLFSSRGEKTPVFVVTSAHAGAGKSLTSANIALSFSMLGKKVLLVDGDMRCPTVHKIFDIDNEEEGLSSLLSSYESNPLKYVTKTDTENLFLLLSGAIPPNPSELLSNESIGGIIDKMCDNFDIVIIDMPPVIEVTDALLLAPYTTGYVMVVRSEISKRTEVADAIELIERNKGKIAGFVLNAINFKSRMYGYGKYGKYGKYGSYNRYNTRNK